MGLWQELRNGQRLKILLLKYFFFFAAICRVPVEKPASRESSSFYLPPPVAPLPPSENVWIDLNGVIVTALPLSSVFGKSDANGGREGREKAE